MLAALQRRIKAKSGGPLELSSIEHYEPPLPSHSIERELALKEHNLAWVETDPLNLQQGVAFSFEVEVIKSEHSSGNSSHTQRDTLKESRIIKPRQQGVTMIVRIIHQTVITSIERSGLLKEIEPLDVINGTPLSALWLRICSHHIQQITSFYDGLCKPRASARSDYPDMSE